LSVRYSNSPALRLQIASSRLRDSAVLLVAGGATGALYLLWQQGHAQLACALLPVVAVLAPALRRDALTGCELCWHRGQWSLWRGRERQLIALSPRSTWLPGLIYLAWRELPAGRQRYGWIFSDCAPAGQLRRLRVRLALQR
jgi:hypothetical protein